MKSFAVTFRVLVAVLVVLLARAGAQCPGCQNTNTVHSFWFPGLTIGDQDLPNQQDPRWYYESTTQTWFYSPSENPVDVSVGFGASFKVDAQSFEGEVQIGPQVTFAYSNFDVLKITGYGPPTQESGLCVGQVQLQCHQEGRCNTFFEFTVEMVAATRTSSSVSIQMNDEWKGKVHVGSPPKHIRLDHYADCDGANQATDIEIDIPNQWSDPNLFSIEWRCTSCPSTL